MNATWVNRLPLCHFAETAQHTFCINCMYEYSIQFSNNKQQQQQQLGKDQNIVQHIWSVLYAVVQYSTPSIHGTLDPNLGFQGPSLDIFECSTRPQIEGAIRAICQRPFLRIHFPLGQLCSVYRAHSVARLRLVHMQICNCNRFAFY